MGYRFCLNLTEEGISRRSKVPENLQKRQRHGRPFTVCFTKLFKRAISLTEPLWATAFVERYSELYIYLYIYIYIYLFLSIYLSIYLYIYIYNIYMLCKYITGFLTGPVS